MSRIKIGNIKGPKGDRGETGAVGPKGEQGIQGPVGPAGGVNSVNGKTGDVNIADALGYTPAGGENLVLDSKQEIVNSSYPLNEYELSQRIEVGKTYTVSLWGELSDSKTYFGIYSRKSNTNGLCRLYSKTNGVYTATFRVIDQEESEEELRHLRVYPIPDNGSISSVQKIKLELGTVTNPIWTPAPEDVVVRSELEALIKRVAALEKKSGITSADSFMELPSADVMESGSETASADDAAEDVGIN